MFDNSCFVCGKSTKNRYPLCNLCHPKVIESGASCSVCGIETSKFVKVCPSCREEDYTFRGNFSLFSYGGVPKEILTQYKFKKDRSFASFYVEYILNYLNDEFPDKNYILVPVPTSFLKRKIKNGYQLDEIVSLLKKEGVNVKPLLGKRHSKTQKKLDKVERSENLKGRYILRKQHRAENIILFDDVFTTGATINECSKVLESCSKHIYSITLYRD